MAEELNQPNMTSDDSCITEYIEIVPLARERTELDHCDEIKQESPATELNVLEHCDETNHDLLQDIKQEPPDGLDAGCDVSDRLDEICDVKDEPDEVCDVKDTCTALEVRLQSCICMC